MAQLTNTDYPLPAYAQDMLYLVTDDQTVQAGGERGDFNLSKSNGDVRLTWGSANGPILTIWEELGKGQLDWDGQVTVGGFIERLHAHEIGGLEVVVIEVVGGPL